MKTAKLSVLPIKDLNPAEYNPRKKLKPGDKEYEKIKHSIEEFGFADPVVVNSDMTIIGGHQRVTVAAALGYTEVPCAIVEVSKTQEKALNIALNKISGEWNQELLADLIQDLQDSDFDVGFTGFEPPEIEQLFSKVHDKKVKEDDFDVEAELKKPTVAQTGDVWLLGKHRVICGDSILPETYNILMDGRKANLVLTDPPYNVDVEETAGKIKNDNMADEDFYRFLFAAFVNMEQNMEDDASIYVFHADTEGLNFRKAFADAGFKLSGCCIWKKNALVLGRNTSGMVNHTAMNSAVMEVHPVLTPERMEKRQNGRRMKEDGEPMFTLTSQDRHGVFVCEKVQQNEETMLRVRNGTKQGYDEAHVGDGISLAYPESDTRRGRVGKGCSQTLDCSGQMGTLMKCGRIRRLTPRECFRLQGFPDVLFDKAASVNSDAQLYKQAGNAVTATVAFAVAMSLPESREN